MSVAARARSCPYAPPNSNRQKIIYVDLNELNQDQGRSLQAPFIESLRSPAGFATARSPGAAATQRRPARL